MPGEDEPYYGDSPYAEERRRMDALPERERWSPIDPSTKQGLDRLRTPVPRIQRELYELISGGPPSFPVSEAYAGPMDDFGYAEEYTEQPIPLPPHDALEVLRGFGFTLDMGEEGMAPQPAQQFVDLDKTIGEFTVPPADYSFKDTHGYVREAAPISIGKTEFSVRDTGPSDDVIVQVHGDETDAARVAENYEGGGKVYQVAGEGAHEHRHIRVNGLRIDPNRLFSREGAERSFRHNNPRASSRKIRAAVDKVMEGSGELLKNITPKGNGVLYSLHNNQRGYNVDKAIKDSTRGLKKPGQSKHNFYLVTSEEDYNALSNGVYNVVLQTAKGVGESETGSLSNVMALSGKRYVNIETKLGFGKDPAIQQKMLDYAKSVLGGEGG